MLSIAICDDEPLHREYAEKAIKSQLKMYAPEIDKFPSAEALLQSMSAGDYAPDIAVLDIELGGKDGISLAKELNRIAPRCKIVFLTSYIDYAPDVYFTDHTWFVLKRDIEKCIAPALEKAIISLTAEGSSTPSIILKSGSKISLIPISQVLYTELVGRKTCVVTESGKILSNQSPKELLSNIPEGSVIRCHQSFYVNVDKIISIDKTDIVLSGDIRIPVSRTYKPNVKNLFFAKLRAGAAF